MKTCPKCGNKYRPDVEVCPNDGTPLGSPAAKPSGGPPATAPPPAEPGPKAKSAPPTKSKAKPAPKSASDWSVESPSLRESSSAGSWIFALVASLVLVGVFVVLRDRIIPPEPGADADAEASVGENDEDKPKKRKKRRRGKRGKRPAGAKGEEYDYDDYDWEQDYVEDDLVLGDVFSERSEQQIVYEEVEEPEPYQPTREEYQPDGKYRPVASYAEPGARNNVVELDLRTGGGSSPLDEGQVKSVLSVRKLSSCYDRWVQKIPQMQGRVWMDFVVAPDGHVAAVKITRSQLRSRVVEKCLVQRARNFRFPASQGGQRTKFDTHFDFTNR